jgi:hypothetical protein
MNAQEHMMEMVQPTAIRITTTAAGMVTAKSAYSSHFVIGPSHSPNPTAPQAAP